MDKYGLLRTEAYFGAWGVPVPVLSLDGQPRAPFGVSGGLKQCLWIDESSCYWQATGLEDNGVGLEFETLANLV